MKKEKRSKILINPSFQLRFIFYYISAVLLSISIFYLAELYFFNQMFKEGIELNLPANHVYFKLIVKQKMFMTKIFAITALFVTIILFVFGLLLSHRIAGPFIKLNNYFKKLGKGEPTGKISFRKNDFFQEIPNSYNEMWDYLEERHKSGAKLFKEDEAP